MTIAPIESPEDEAKEAVLNQYRMILSQREEYEWDTKLLDAGDYFVIFVHIVKSGGRSFLIRLQCDDYPEIAPEMRFIDPTTFDNVFLDTPVSADCYPMGNEIVAPNKGRGPLPVPCIIGHRDYYAGSPPWHTGWTIPPTDQHSLYQLVVNIRNAIIFHWS